MAGPLDPPRAPSPASANGGIPSPLSDYFTYNEGAFGTAAAPSKKGSAAWTFLLDLPFQISSVTPDPTRPGFFTQDVGFQMPASESWPILPDNMYTVTGLVLETAGWSPPNPGIPPPPTSTLTGNAAIGSKTVSVTIPLDETTSWTHDVSTYTVGEILNAFGAMKPGVGDLASTTLPCAIAATTSSVLSAITTGATPQIVVNYGDTPQVSFSLAVLAVDPAEGGVLQSLTLSASDIATWEIGIFFLYFGAPCAMTYPYPEFQCAPDDPPPLPPSRDKLREPIELYIQLMITAIIWSSVCSYTSKWFSSLTSSALDTVAGAISDAAASLSVSLSLGDLAGGMWTAFTTQIESPGDFVGALAGTGLAGATSPNDLAESLHTANPSYAPADVASGLFVGLKADSATIAAALMAAWNFGTDQAGGDAILEALVTGAVSTDPVVLGSVERQVWAAASPTNIALSLVRSLGAPALTVLVLSQDLLSVFPAVQPQALTSASLAAALAAAGYSCRDAGKGLHAIFPEACAAFVADLMTAYAAVGAPPSALDIATCCADAAYGLFDAEAAMINPPARYFSLAAARAALQEAYVVKPNWLQLNTGGMSLPQNSFSFGGYGPFTLEFEVLLAPGSQGTLVGQSAPGRPQKFPVGYSFTLDASPVSLDFGKFNDNGVTGTFNDWSAEIPINIFDGLPHTLAVVAPGADGQLYALFVDGIQLSVSGGPDTLGNVSSSETLRLGNTGDTSLNGGFLAIRFWGIALTAAQLTANLQTPPDPSLTIGYWDFSDGTTRDRSPSRVNGALYRGAVIGPVF